MSYTLYKKEMEKGKNMTLKEMTNYMLHARSSSSKLWVESINYGAYL